MESGTHIDKGDLNRFIIENDGAGCLPASLSSLFSEGKIIKLTIESKFEYIIPFLNIFRGDSIRGPSHPEAQVVRHLISSASVTESKSNVL